MLLCQPPSRRCCANSCWSGSWRFSACSASRLPQRLICQQRAVHAAPVWQEPDPHGLMTLHGGSRRVRSALPDNSRSSAGSCGPGPESTQTACSNALLVFQGADMRLSSSAARLQVTSARKGWHDQVRTRRPLSAKIGNSVLAFRYGQLDRCPYSPDRAVANERRCGADVPWARTNLARCAAIASTNKRARVGTWRWYRYNAQTGAGGVCQSGNTSTRRPAARSEAT